jgi:hypothetical protein
MRSSTVVSETAARLRASAASSRRRSAIFLALAFILLTTKAGQGRAPATPLSFFKNYFVTGDYRVYGVPIKGSPASGGFTTKDITIPLGSVPAGAEPVAAYLYWSAVVAEQSPESGSAGAQFDGNELADLTKVLNPIGASPCWSSGGAGGGGGGDANKKLLVNRADVVRFFDDVDSNGNALINGTTHTVKLPNNDGGNVTPFTIGASIVLVYRTPTEKFRSIVFYDGGFTINQGTDTLTQPIQGFYDASHSDPNAKGTFIVGDGQSNFYDRLRFSDNLRDAAQPPTPPQLLSEDAFSNGWDYPTFDLDMSAGASSATLTLDHASESSYDCLTGGAFIVSLEPEDADGDGLLNRWETSTAGNDPFGQPLPDLAGMGADPCRKDLFVELGYFREPLGWDSETSAIQPPPGPHSHRPGEDDLVRTRAILNDVAVPFKNAPVANNYAGCTPPTGWTTGIKVHFDAGNIGQTGADEFIIPANKARGGEEIEEKACVPNPTAGITCQFPGYEGVVGWKVGFYYYKDAAVDPTTGAQLSVANEDACEPNCQRRRFDRNRKDIFHYFLFAHALGVPVNLCLLPNGLPDTECQENNPDFHIPRREGGAGDKPGGDAVVTTGLWASVSDFVMSSIITHELGHHLWRDHSGDPFVSFEPNCNPNYLSVMNYIFEYDGLKKNDGVPRIDFSRQALGSVNEDSLPAGLGTLDYRTAWYAPKSSVHQSLGTTVATKRCDGTLPGAGEEMIRIEGTGLNTSPLSGPTQGTIPIDWNGDLNTTNDFPNLSQDITFNGVTNNDTVPPPNPLKLLLGSDDWTPMANFGLRQIGGRRSLAGLSLDASKFDGSKFDGSKFDGSKFDGSKFDGSKFDGSKEADFETVTAYGHPAHSLKATWVGRNVVAEWKEPTAKQTGGISAYLLYRVDGLSVTVDNFKKKALVARTPFLTATDTRVTAGKPYAYFVIVEFGDGTTSGMSNWANPQ